MKTKIPKRKLQYIRIFSPTWESGPHSEAFTSVAMRFALKLAEDCAYRFGDFNCLDIHLTPAAADGAIKIWDEKWEPWAQHIDLGCPLEMLLKADDNQATNIIANALLELASMLSAQTQPIEAVRAELIANGADTIIWMKSKRVERKRYTIAPYFKVKGLRPDFVQVFVRLIEPARKTSEQSGETFKDYLVIETDDLEAFSLVGSISLKGDRLFVFPKTSAQGEASAQAYKSRGFSLPIEVPVSLSWKGPRVEQLRLPIEF
ncbi:MAG TPA: hypothetical protein V6C81_14040 [Planktothrix sp.]|jgi:hypothetical protein